jgi:hypothetical protein
MLGRGHGSAFIRVFTEGLFEAGVPRVILDPIPLMRAQFNSMKRLALSEPASSIRPMGLHF